MDFRIYGPGYVGSRKYSDLGVQDFGIYDPGNIGSWKYKFLGIYGFGNIGPREYLDLETRPHLGDAVCATSSSTRGFNTGPASWTSGSSL